MIWSPSTTRPRWSTARQRSASPSCAMPRSARWCTTAAARVSRWVEPTPSLMLRPSGSAPITVTRAPASVKTWGEMPDAAPCAQSSTMWRPSRRCGSVESRWTRYRSSASANRRMRPTSAPLGSSLAVPIAASIRSSTSSGSFTPPAAKNLMPLSGAGLWDAEIMTPKSARESAIRNAAAGVGTTPASNTSTPELASPAETALERNSPEIRGSRATTATGRRPDARRPSAILPSPSTTAAARARLSAMSTVRSALASPRTPSVPNRRGMEPCLISASSTGAPCGPS